MLLQRLVNDDDTGFGYDYMGSAEYENGATKNGRTALARLFLNGDLCARRIRFSEKMGRMMAPSIDVLAMGGEETLEHLGDPAVISVTKEPFYIHRAKYAGWMQVGWDEESIDPLMLVRLDAPDEEIKARVSAFLKDPIAYLKEKAA